METSTRTTRRSVVGIGVFATLFATLAAAYLIVPPQLRPIASVASGYMARVACACHFIGGRTLESCLMDREPGMEQVRVSVDAATRRVTAGVPFIASAGASYTPGLGCVLDP